MSIVGSSYGFRARNATFVETYYPHLVSFYQMFRKLLSLFAIIAVATAAVPASDLPAAQLPELFNLACETSRDGQGAPIDNQTKLFFWARYKKATGEAIKSADSLSMIKMAYMAKLGAMSKEQAMREYIEKMDEVRPGWRN